MSIAYVQDRAAGKLKKRKRFTRTTTKGSVLGCRSARIPVSRLTIANRTMAVRSRDTFALDVAVLSIDKRHAVVNIDCVPGTGRIGCSRSFVSWRLASASVASGDEKAGKEKVSDKTQTKRMAGQLAGVSTQHTTALDSVSQRCEKTADGGTDSRQRCHARLLG